jgi:2-polyprenyl-3-methyl-5-hydroxy-6-metoxy-1,4-benzoquinol methylase
MSAETMLREFYEAYWRADVPGPLSDPFAQTRLRILCDELARLDASRILDAGCGSGELVAALVREGYQATGIELASAALERARPELALARHSIEDLPWPVEGGSQDVVVSFEVIEHLLAPRRLLEGAAAALRPGGRLAISTPYHGRLKNLALALAGFDRHFAVEGEHVRFFTDRALAALLADTGFAIERIRHYGRFAPLWAGTFVWARKR